jgi:hypothetical protein
MPITLTDSEKIIIDALDPNMQTSMTDGVLNPDSSPLVPAVTGYDTALALRDPATNTTTDMQPAIKNPFKNILAAFVRSLSSTVPILATPLLNSWVNFGAGYRDAGYYKDALGIVHLSGLIASGTVGQSAFNLPVGYRPAQTLLFGTTSNASAGAVSVTPAGDVTPATPSNNAWVSLEGITFNV